MSSETSPGGVAHLAEDSTYFRVGGGCRVLHASRLKATHSQQWSPMSKVPAYTGITQFRLLSHQANIFIKINQVDLELGSLFLESYRYIRCLSPVIVRCNTSHSYKYIWLGSQFLVYRIMIIDIGMLHCQHYCLTVKRHFYAR